MEQLYYLFSSLSKITYQRVSGIRVITKLPNSEQSSKRKVKTHKYINRQNQQKDIRVVTQRHLILATGRQFSILATAKTWYIDATFRVVRRPFYQLLSVHAFVRSGTKQIPIVLAVMSRRRAKDYLSVSSFVMYEIENMLEDNSIKNILGTSFK